MADYYLVIGVPRDANPVQIKRAYRLLSLRHHPDHTGPSGEEQFRQIKEAYDALNDAARRAEYDRALAAADRRAASRPFPSPARPRMARPIVDRPVELFGGFGRYAPSRDEVFDTFVRDFTGRHAPKSQTPLALNVEMVLSPAQAAAGGAVPFHVPAARPCPRCGGTGRTGFFACDACDGHGVQWETARVDVLVPQSVRDGTVIPVSLRHLGAPHTFLNLHVRVAAAGAIH